MVQNIIQSDMSSIGGKSTNNRVFFLKHVGVFEKTQVFFFQKVPFFTEKKGVFVKPFLSEEIQVKNPTCESAVMAANLIPRAGGANLTSKTSGEPTKQPPKSMCVF